MTHKGESYHIYRNPEYLRPRKRKGADGKELTKEKEKAILTLPDGSSVEGSSEVTRKIEELLCLEMCIRDRYLVGQIKTLVRRTPDD